MAYLKNFFTYTRRIPEMAILGKCRIPCYRRVCVSVSVFLRFQYQIAKHAELIHYSKLLLTQILSVTIIALFWSIMNS